MSTDADTQPTGQPYVYFVSYSHAGRHGMGFGMTDMRTKFPVTTVEQLNEFRRLIAGSARLPESSVVVLSYQLLRGPEVVNGSAGGQP